jgi:hypothetical protein
MDQSRRELYLRVANPLIHMLAINVGRSLYVERKHNSSHLDQRRVPTATLHPASRAPVEGTPSLCAR